jgi:uncharacterized protein (DUF302 family)
MPDTQTAKIDHTDVATGRTYGELVAAFEGTLGRWEPSMAQGLVGRKATWSEVQAEAGRVAGPRGLMIIAGVDQGSLTSLSGNVKHCRLYLVGNPLIATHIFDIDPHGAFYVPFRVALYDGGDPASAHICYDRPSSFLAALGHPQLAEIGAALDAKIDDVVRSVSKVPLAAH